MALEMDVAELAAQRAKTSLLIEMSEKVAKMFASLNSPEEYLMHDLQFHQIIASA